MNKTILPTTVCTVFFLALSHSNANVCTISGNNLNDYQKTSQGLVTISNETDQCKFNPINYYVRDTYRTRNLNIRAESRRIRLDGKEQERRVWLRVGDTRRVKLTRSESLPDIRRERVRNARESEAEFTGIDQRALERNRRFLENRFNERTFRQEVRDSRFERQTIREDTDTRRRTAHIREKNMAAIRDKYTSTSWPFSNFVQSAIGVLGLYYFGMHNKSAK